MLCQLDVPKFSFSKNERAPAYRYFIRKNKFVFQTIDKQKHVHFSKMKISERRVDKAKLITFTPRNRGTFGEPLSTIAEKHDIFVFSRWFMKNGRYFALSIDGEPRGTSWNLQVPLNGEC